MSIPDEATYILYGIVYISLGFWVLRSFLKLGDHPKTSPNQTRKNTEKVLAITRLIDPNNILE